MGTQVHGFGEAVSRAQSQRVIPRTLPGAPAAPAAGTDEELYRLAFRCTQVVVVVRTGRPRGRSVGRAVPVVRVERASIHTDRPVGSRVAAVVVGLARPRPCLGPGSESDTRDTIGTPLTGHRTVTGARTPLVYSSLQRGRNDLTSETGDRRAAKRNQSLNKRMWLCAVRKDERHFRNS